VRIRSLDGLRGVAALLVVLGHMRLVLYDTPHSAIWSQPVLRHLLDILGVVGGHAVWLFFVLSGVVLTKLANRPNFDYGRYLLSRLTRLYLPAWAAVAFAVITIIIVPRVTPGYGQWIDTKPTALTLQGILGDLTLVTGVNGGTISPLWTLQWEVLFSLLLVVFLAAFKRLHLVLGLVAALAGACLGSIGNNPFLLYMSMFAIGVVLAFAWEGLMARLVFLSRMHPGVFIVLSAGLIVVAVAANSLALLVTDVQITRYGLTMPIVGTVGSLLGVAALIVLAGVPGPFRAILETRPLQWLGLVSFSLYLIHEPVLVALVRVWGPSAFVLFVALILCLVAADLFSRFVERPTHRLATRMRQVPSKSPELAASDVP